MTIFSTKRRLVAAAFAALAATGGVMTSATLDLRPALALAGSLAGPLVGRLPGDSNAARQFQQASDLASGFVDGLLGEGLWHPTTTILESRAAWSEWFASDVWDQTWVVVDAERTLVWLLCLSSPRPPRLH